MDEQVQHALEHDSLIDITTRGRATGQSRRIEIRFHNIEGHLYITGRPPRRRDWYANLLTHPEFTLHLKQSQKLGRYRDIEAWVESSPLVAVQLLVE